ncbi:MAG: YggS family pyridoxal phosphate-dependent enzyme [Bacteroidetes bacterium]|nr:YggS family pyridoxal phosphate-dependent enzyme [Bacteroidota bacterium]
MADSKIAPDQIATDAIAERLADVRDRIAQACDRAGRSPDEITLVSVTKTFPLDAIEHARSLGLHDFGENKVQEMVAKAEEEPGELNGGTLRWHMIGHLQRNKAKDVVAHADLFHALDSPRLAKELNKRARKADRVMPCLVQVNVSGEDSKYGIHPDETHDYLDSLAQYPHLHILGLMTLAEPTEDPEDVRPQFRQMRRLAETYDATDNPRVEMRYLSMGMSGDFEVAVEEGATHLRLGTALFGPRSY